MVDRQGKAEVVLICISKSAIYFSKVVWLSCLLSDDIVKIILFCLSHLSLRIQLI